MRNLFDRDVEFGRQVRNLPFDVVPRRVRIAWQQDRGHADRLVPGMSHRSRIVSTTVLLFLLNLHDALHRERRHNKRQLSTHQGVEIRLA